MKVSNFKPSETKNPSTTVETITPDIAAEYLANNTHNRKLKERHISTLAKAMTDGAWQFNGDSIRFDTNGTMIDGQHRCEAVIRSGVAIKTLVVRGLDSESFHTIDTNKTRSGADVLHIDGSICNTAVLAGALRLVIYSNELSPAWIGTTTGRNKAITNQDILDANSRHPGVTNSVISTSTSDRKYCRRIMSPSVCAFAHYWLSNIDADDAETFFDWIEYCDGLSRSHPANLLRTKLSEISVLGSKNEKTRRLSLALIFRAWNAIREGEDLKQLKWSAASSFPTPR